MAYIYCITNLINGKLYVGKTTYSITKRFLKHCEDSKRERCEKRPLYDAMNKYGTENFIVELLCDCDELELDSYEVMYIDKLDTYNNGYNATRGGEGSILFDYKKIIELYQSGLNTKETAAKVQCCVDTVRKVLNIYSIPRHKDVTRGNSKAKRIVQLSKEGEELLTFDSTVDGLRWLYDNGYCKTFNPGNAYKLSQCANGKLKTAYKFKWRWE